MSLYTLATGTLIADPQQRRAANGNDYAIGALRAPTEDGTAVVSIIAFEQAACDALLAHRNGDALSIAGRSKLTAWTGRDGETRHGISVVADQVISARQAATKARKQRGGAADRRRDRSLAAPPVPPPPGWDIPPEAGRSLGVTIIIGGLDPLTPCCLEGKCSRTNCQSISVASHRRARRLRRPRPRSAP